MKYAGYLKIFVYIKYTLFPTPDAPGASAPPEVVSIRHESAILTWSDPKDTGGSPITGKTFLYYSYLFIYCSYLAVLSYLKTFTSNIAYRILRGIQR